MSSDTGAGAGIPSSGHARFTTSVVGSMPRSTFVRDLLGAEERMDPDEYRRAMDAAVGYIVRLQEHAGLDVVTDGEWRRRSYIGVIAELAHGFELGTNPANGRPWTVVVDRLAPREPGFHRQRDLVSARHHRPPDQGHAPGTRVAGRTDVGPRAVHARVSHARVVRS